MNEIWKPIIIEKQGVTYDYTGLYEVSNLGRVRSLNYGGHGEIKVLKPSNSNAYLRVALHKDGRGQRFLVHRLVATMFIPNPDNLPVVNHKNENPSNNCVDNLEWCTVKYNTNYGTCPQRMSEAHKGKTSAFKGKKHSKTAKCKISETQRGSKNPKAKKVLCVETGQVFDCIADAEKWLGKSGICSCLKGRQKTCGGFHWEYVEELV